MLAGVLETNLLDLPLHLRGANECLARVKDSQVAISRINSVGVIGHSMVLRLYACRFPAGEEAHWGVLAPGERHRSDCDGQWRLHTVAGALLSRQIAIVEIPVLSMLLIVPGRIAVARRCCLDAVSGREEQLVEGKDGEQRH